MLFALRNAFASGRPQGNGLDTLLPRFVFAMQGDHYRFVDGGAGIGHTGLAYRNVLKMQMNPTFRDASRIVRYEPLEENVCEMSDRLADGPEFVLRQFAVTSSNGKMMFVVPSRLTGENEHRGNGTSYNGFVLEPGQPVLR